MSERKIEVVISAKDDYTAALAKFNEAIGKMDGMNSRLEGSTSRVEKEFGKLTSASNFAASGLMRFRSMMEGMAFGGAIGLVSGAVGVLTETLIAHWKENSAERIDGISSAVAKQAGAWKLLPEPIGGATNATIALYNAQLKYLQLVSQDEGSAIKKQIENLEQMRRTSEINMMAFPNRAAYFRKEIANFDIKLSEARVNYEKWLAIMGQTPATIAQVTSALSPAAKAIKSALELPKGGGSLMAFVMSDLDMAKPKLELTGLELSKVFMDSFQQGASANAAGDLNFSMAFVDKVHSSLIRASYDPAVIEAKQRLLDLEASSPFGALGQMKEAARISEIASIKLQYDNKLYLLQDYNTRVLQAMVDAGANQSALETVYANLSVQTDEQMAQQKLAAYAQTAAMMTGFAANLYSALGQKQKAFFYASKAAAVAEAIINAELGAAKAVGQGGIWGIPFATIIRAMGYANAAIIAATTITGTGTGGSAGSSPTVSSSFDSSFSPVPPARVEQRPALNVTMQVFAMDPSSVRWDELMEKQIAPALERLSRDRDVALNIKVASR